jgi:hypothetical protein
MSDSALITVKFCLSGKDLDFDQINSALGLTATGMWNPKPELSARGLDKSDWYFGVTKKAFESTNDAVQHVLDTLWGHRKEIKKLLLSNTHIEASMIVNVTINVNRPVYDFELDTMNKLTELDCSLHLDIFDYSD